MDRLAALQDAGVSIWLDTLSRDLLDTGEFERLIHERHITGATSNPTIFATAISSSDRYDEQLRRLTATGLDDHTELFFALALDDVRRAADLLRPVHDESHGADGYVSFECTPDIADDTEATVRQARDLWARLARPNVMIKVPATAAGIPAVEQLTADGINVNITLLFSLDRYRQVLHAHQAGLEARLAGGRPIDPIASVASFFVSRVDAMIDEQLPADSPLRGRIALANAALAYQTHLQTLEAARWRNLADRGARPQRPLWASTGTKNPSYSDVLYVERLIAPGVVNTMPSATLEAFADHGVTRVSLDDTTFQDARRALERLTATGIDLDTATSELEREGVEAFTKSYAQLRARIDDRIGSLRPAAAS
jgi:transaldolase